MDLPVDHDDLIPGNGSPYFPWDQERFCHDVLSIANIDREFFTLPCSIRGNDRSGPSATIQAVRIQS